MKKYIDAEGVMRVCYDSFLKTGNKAYREIFALVEAVPAADVAEVVRCCKCIYWDRDTIRHQSNDFRDWNEAECLVLAELDGYNEINRYTEADDFCSRGERKDG